MIPEVSEQMKEVFETEYPLAECTVAIGFFFVLLLEQIVTRKGLLVSNAVINCRSTYRSYTVIASSQQLKSQKVKTKL